MIGELPRHLYVWIDSRFTHVQPCGFVPAVWFGLVSFPGRSWGCTVLLESGAVYRNLPPHAIAFAPSPREFEDGWDERDAQVWDCYGERFVAIEYRYLAGLPVTVRDPRDGDPIDRDGVYLFSVCPVGDGFSAEPAQAKEFSFIKLDANDRLTIQPTNHLMFYERSFTRPKDFPTGLKRQTEFWSCE